MKLGWLRPPLARLHARLHGSRVINHGKRNAILLSDSIRRQCRIRVSGNDNQIQFAAGCRLWDLDLEIVGDGHLLRVGADCQVRGGRWLLEDKGSSIVVGASTTMIGDTLIASEGTRISLGEDCMLSSNVEIRSSDGHSIFNGQTGERLNPAQDVKVGKHVWLGAGVRILKGVTVGDHSIVAAGALVSKDLPPHCVAAGIPARVLREGVTWDRSRTAPTSRLSGVQASPESVEQ
jgi:acetyltransferase-like isoleucine patch superfamily enzyme